MSPSCSHLHFSCPVFCRIAQSQCLCLSSFRSWVCVYESHIFLSIIIIILLLSVCCDFVSIFIFVSNAQQNNKMAFFGQSESAMQRKRQFSIRITKRLLTTKKNKINGFFRFEIFGLVTCHTPGCVLPSFKLFGF